MEYIKLSNGVQLPVMGCGTNSYGKEGGVFEGAYTGDLTDARAAIEAGYRFFDTAEIYGTEELVGRAVEGSGLPRSDFFLSTKMRSRWSEPRSLLTEADAERALERSLRNLRTDYIDLYFIHFPCDDPASSVNLWRVFEKYYRQGVLKAIGVSNFTPEQIDALHAETEILPMVNQIRINPESPNTETVAYCQARGILPMAYCPLNFDAKFRPAIAAIGEKYGKTWAQTILRYQLQRGIVTIPKSHNPAHQKQNLEIFDFALTADDMTALNAVPGF